MEKSSLPSSPRRSRRPRRSQAQQSAPDRRPPQRREVCAVIPRNPPFRVLIAIALHAHASRVPFSLIYEDRPVTHLQDPLIVFKEDAGYDVLEVVKRLHWVEKRCPYEDFLMLAADLQLGSAKVGVTDLQHLYQARLRRAGTGRDQMKVVVETVELIQELLQERDYFLAARRKAYPTLTCTITLGDQQVRCRIVTADEPLRVIQRPDDQLLVLFHLDAARHGHCQVRLNVPDASIGKVFKAVQVMEFLLRHPEQETVPTPEEYQAGPWTWGDHSFFSCGTPHRPNEGDPPLVTPEKFLEVLKRLK